MSKGEQQNSGFQPGWRVVYTASRQEKKVSGLLEREGIDHYLPLVKKLRVWSDRKKWVDMPLFPGYMFVKPDAMQRDRVLEIPGVARYLRYNGTDALMREEEINAIRSIIEKGYTVEQAGPHLEKGDRVRIESGPLKGIEDEVLQGGKGGDQVRITFDTISQTIRVNLPAGYLKRIKTA